MQEFKIDTPDNIMELSEKEIASLCATGEGVRNAQTRIQFIKSIYQVLGYTLTNDLLYALADEPKEQLIIAQAGGGKTTTVSVKIALEKIYRKSRFTRDGKLKGDRVLSLVYNSANVPDMLNRHTDVISTINRLKVPGLQLDFDLECRTIHSFCLKWIKIYASELGLFGYNRMEDDLAASLMQSAILAACKKNGIAKIPKALTSSNLMSLYNFIVETKSNLEDIKDTDKVVDLGVEVSVIEMIFKTYTVTKKFSKGLDNTDLLINFRRLLDENAEAKKRIQEYYDFITADEIQDFTPFIMDLLRDIVADHTQLVCIGDDDQAIYGFRGADHNNALRFKTFFNDSKIHILQVNRRCPSDVLSLASKIINLNTKRFPKKIKGVKGKGNVYFRGYNDRIGQFISITNLIKNMSGEDKESCVVAYRERTSSIMMSNYLYEANIPFYVQRGYGPFDFPLFHHVMTVLRALQSRNDKRQLLNLYKVLPITKGELQEALHFDAKANNFTDGSEFVDIDKIEFSQVRMNNPVFKKTYQILIQISQRMDSLQMTQYVNGIIDLVKKYFFNFIAQETNIDPDIYDFCSKKCTEFFNKNFNFKELYAYYSSEQTRLYQWKMNKVGVCLTTFHALKGLEFRNVILTDLAESIFPNFGAIDFRPYDEDTKVNLKEAENRLMYVALTRSKQNLYLYYSKQDPSIYITILNSVSDFEEQEHNKANVVLNQENSLNSFSSSQGLAEKINVLKQIEKGQSRLVNPNVNSEVTKKNNEQNNLIKTANVFEEVEIELDIDGVEELDSINPNDGTGLEPSGEFTKEENEILSEVAVGAESSLDKTLNEEPNEVLNQQTKVDNTGDSISIEVKDGSDESVTIKAKPATSFNYRDNLVNSLFGRKRG